MANNLPPILARAANDPALKHYELALLLYYMNAQENPAIANYSHLSASLNLGCSHQVIGRAAKALVAGGYIKRTMNTHGLRVEVLHG